MAALPRRAGGSLARILLGAGEKLKRREISKTKIHGKFSDGEGEFARASGAVGGSDVAVDGVFGFARMEIGRLRDRAVRGWNGNGMFRGCRGVGGAGSDDYGGRLRADLAIGELLFVLFADGDGVEKLLGIGAIDGSFGGLKNAQGQGFGIGGLPGVGENVSETDSIGEIAGFEGDGFSTVGEGLLAGVGINGIKGGEG